jgi:L-ascorbate metabolism protein UlaG (beta-lactamase superfamily)
MENFEKDIIRTASGDLEISFIGHGSLMFKHGGKIIHVDPYSQVGDYSKLPKGDLILLAHDHPDHYDPLAFEAVKAKDTVVVYTESCAQRVAGGIVMKNGDVRTIMGIKIEAVPAYNIMHKRPDGQLFHPKGYGNGYVFTFGDTLVYVAGDTENIPEMKALRGIAYAFLPMNLPYTMTPEMTADAARMFRPKVLYPYHYGETDPSLLVALLKNTPEIEVRVRKMM